MKKKLKYSVLSIFMFALLFFGISRIDAANVNPIDYHNNTPVTPDPLENLPTNYAWVQNWGGNGGDRHVEHDYHWELPDYNLSGSDSFYCDTTGCRENDFQKSYWRSWDGNEYKNAVCINANGHMPDTTNSSGKYVGQYIKADIVNSKDGQNITIDGPGNTKHGTELKRLAFWISAPRNVKLTTFEGKDIYGLGLVTNLPDHAPTDSSYNQIIYEQNYASNIFRTYFKENLGGTWATTNSDIPIRIGRKKCQADLVNLKYNCSKNEFDDHGTFGGHSEYFDNEHGLLISKIIELYIQVPIPDGYNVTLQYFDTGDLEYGDPIRPYQDFLSWQVDIKGYVGVQKQLSGKNNSYYTNNHFKYSVTGPGITGSATVCTNNNGLATYGYNNGAGVLDLGNTYVFKEEIDNNTGFVIVYSDSSCQSLSDPQPSIKPDETNNEVSVDVNNVGTITTKNYKNIEYGHIAVQKKVGQQKYSSSTYRFAYELLDSRKNSLGVTIYTNGDGLATYYGPNNATKDSIEVGTSFYVREVVDSSTGYAKVYNSNNQEIQSGDQDYGNRPLVKPSGDNELPITVNTTGENRGTFDNKYEYCVNITKKDSKDNTTLAGATFGLYRSAGCSGNPDYTSQPTGSNGKATFTGLSSGTYYVKELNDIPGYALPTENNNCKPVEAQEMKTSTCPGNNDIKEPAKYLSFYKIKEDGTPLTTATFNVTNASNKYIKVKSTRYEDTNCYIFDSFVDSASSNTVVGVTNNQTGRICIAKVPNGTYTAHEIATGDDGYWFNNGKIEEITPGTDIQGNGDKTLKNTPAIITFYKLKDKEKTDNNDYRMSTAIFTVTDGTNQVKAESDKVASGTYKGCYIYKENGSRTQFETDSNGRICIIRIPRNKTYEATEVSTGDPRYYVSSEKISGITPSNTITDITNPNSNTKNYIVNYAYYINFFKTDEEGTPMKGAKFNVKNSKGEYIVSADRGDNSDYPDCYVYDSVSGTATTEYKTDSNGEICIVRTPNKDGNTVLTYTAIETNTGSNQYYVDTRNEYNQIKNIVPLELDSESNRMPITDSNALKLANKPYVINFYKVTEKGTKVGGAEFVLTNSAGKYITFDSIKSSVDGYNGCYKYSGVSNTKTTATKLVSSSVNNTNGVGIGEVCIIKLPQGTYKATETKPVEYHTFGTVVTRSFKTGTDRVSMNDDNKYINEKTEFEFTKTVSEEDGYDDIWKTMSSNELTKIPFTIYDSNNNPVSVIKTSDGVYEYANNNIDGVTGNSTTSLYLNTSRKLKVYHLPKGSYTIKESECCCEDECSSPSSSNCYGFYSPKYGNKSLNSYSFTINDCSTSKTVGKDESTGTPIAVCSTSIATQNLDNSPTEVDFTKSDFYGYADPHATVKFEDEEEISAFDNIVFKVYYLDGNNKVYVDFAKVGDVGSCKTESSYAEYRYVPEDTPASIKNQLTLTKELHTCGGHIHLTHLCRGRKYYIEEISVPDNSVFILPETEEARTKEIDLSCCQENEETKPSTTTIIEDKPTRVTFEKRDSKYGYLIPDETTTFKLYRCDSENCHPSDYSTDEERTAAGIKLVKFNRRGVINGDEEDTGIEVYRAILNTSTETNFVTELHPYYGKLVLRYLESGHTYVLLETVSPQGYTLPRGRNAETSFIVRNDTIEVDEVDVVNKPTSLLIRKYADDGELLEGAEFRIYEGTTCDPHLTAMAQPKTLLKLKTIRDGVYENREIKDTDRVITCTDKEDSRCSDITPTLTLDTYVDTWANFENSVNQYDQRIEIQAGEILIQYLDYGHCYIIEEVKAPRGYSLPEKEEDRFIMVTIEKEDDVVDTYKELVNKPTPFTFYKYDEKNNLIDGGEYKLQKLNKDKKYEDLTVTEEESDGKLYYKVDKESTNKKITTKNGSATVYYLEEGQYRIVETKAPEGMELPAKEINVAVFFVDSEGRVIGNNIIANKPKTEKIEIKPKASAELIVNISTGMQRIRYGLALAVIILFTFGLLYVQGKRKKS